MNGKMKFVLWGCVAMALFVVHIAIIIIVDNWSRLGKPYVAPPEKPRFSQTTYHYVDKKTGEKLAESREITVPLKFADPETLKNAPPPPKSPVVQAQPKE